MLLWWFLSEAWWDVIRPSRRLFVQCPNASHNNSIQYDYTFNYTCIYKHITNSKFTLSTPPTSTADVQQPAIQHGQSLSVTLPSSAHSVLSLKPQPTAKARPRCHCMAPTLTDIQIELNSSLPCFPTGRWGSWWTGCTSSRGPWYDEAPSSRALPPWGVDWQSFRGRACYHVGPSQWRKLRHPIPRCAAHHRCVLTSRQHDPQLSTDNMMHCQN